jgi:hypothetical protein
MPRAVTIKSLPQAFEPIKEMEAVGREGGEADRRRGWRA